MDNSIRIKVAALGATLVLSLCTATPIIAASQQSDPAGPPAAEDVPGKALGLQKQSNGSVKSQGQINGKGDGMVNAPFYDGEPPVITPPTDLTIEATGKLTSVDLGTASATDNVDTNLTITNDAPSLFPLGTTTVTYSSTDMFGNTGTAIQAVTVVDTTAPLITMPGNISLEATGPLTSATLGTASASDAVDGSVAVINDAPAFFPVGITTVTYTSTDSAGNKAVATQTVTVTDTTAPVISAPANVTIEATANTTAVAIGTASATDLVDGTVAVANNAPTAYPVGVTTVTYSATDAAGNSSTAVQTITVTDTTPPVIQVQNSAVTVEAASPSMAVDLGIVTASDIVDGTITPSSDAPATFALGVTTVTWTATDAAGNGSTATQLVTVQDTTPPAISAPAAVVADSDTGQPITVAIGSATATDAFMPVSISNDAPAAFPLGDTTVIWTATDANGNNATATQLVTVNDRSIFASLPPDPGEAGKATLEGIDSDNDGVRDDVQRWIVMTYPDSEKTRAALIQRTKTMQLFLTDADDSNRTHMNAIKMSKDYDCLSYINMEGAYDISREHKAIFLNTYLRSKTWLQADKHLSGYMFEMLPYQQWKQACQFNPDEMTN